MTSPVGCHFTQLMPIEHEIICYSIFYCTSFILYVCMYNVVYKERVEEEGNNESAIVSPNFSMSLSYGQLSKKSF